jgi:shikimate dehydrogenase
MYGADDTPFVAWARRAGCPALDGLGMLVEQAAESFLLWRGVRPETGEVLADLRNRLRHPWPGNGP